MDTKITADLSTIPVLNLIIIFIGIIAVIVVAAVLVKKFGLQVSKGTIKVSDYEYDQQCLTLSYRLQGDIENIDWELQRSLRQQTKNCSYKIAKMDNVENMCHASRRALYNEFKNPLFDCISNNHFTREFMPTNYESYRKQILEAERETHQILYFEYNLDKCEQNELAEWNKVEDAIVELVDDWLIMAMNEVRKACYRKVNIYEQEVANVEKSKYWSKIIQTCIEKNQGYIQAIDNRLSSMGK